MNNLFEKLKKSIFAKQISYLLIFISFAYIFYLLSINWKKLIYTLPLDKMLASIFLGSIFYGLNTILLAYTWYRLLKVLGEKVDYKTSHYIFGYSQIAKYIPGNVMHYLGRFVLSRNSGMSEKNILTSIFLETLLLAFSALSITFVTVFFFEWNTIFNIIFRKLIIIFFIILFITAIIFLLIFIFKKYRSITKLGYFFKTIYQKYVFRELFYSYLKYFSFFVLNGIFLCFLSKIMWMINLKSNILIFIGAYAASWIIGFVTPGSPGGIGVREALLILILQMYISESQAVTLALVFRIITTLGDILFFFSSSYLNVKYLKIKS